MAEENNTQELDKIEIGTPEPFEPVEEGMYPVIITKISKKTAKKYQSDEEETILLFEFSIDEERKVFKRVRPKLAIKPNPSHLYSIWSAVEGKNPTEEGFKEFHLSNLLNKQLRIVVEQSEKDGRVYNNITSFMKMAAKKEKKK